MQIIIYCKTKFEGIHCYPEAPDEVAYLRQPHRHMFHVKVGIDVFSSDRELEFIMLKHRVDEWLRKHFNSLGVWEMGTLSCEQVAKQILLYLDEKYNTYRDDEPDRQIIVEVNEDNENGAVVYGY